MPGYVSSHKGGTQSGNTVTYALKINEKATIDVTGGALSGGATAGIVVLALLVLGGIGAGVFFYLRRNRRFSVPVAPVVPPTFTYPPPVN